MNAPANILEQQLIYPFGERLPAPAERIEVAPDIFWIRMPLPFALDHINLWLVRDEFAGRDGWTLIDTGASTRDTRALWERVFADGLDGLPIVRLLCTHTHPDHVGLADWIGQRFEAPLWMSLGEYSTGRTWSISDERSVRMNLAHFQRHGVRDGPLLEGVRQRSDRPFTSLVPSMPGSFRRVNDGEIIEIGRRGAKHRWRAIFGYGHSPEHVALYDEARRLLFSGDMILPRISSNVSVFEMEPEANPVAWYMDSLRRYQDCAPDTLAFPSHGRPFRNIHRRIEQLIEHHEDRLAVVLDACRQRPMHAAETVPVMFQREFDTQQTTFAIGETLAHLHALWYRGLVRRETGADGIVRFSATGAPPR
ncbi:MAG: MBL fold metallo-hydrolase [Burkholderiaceae bacterium]